MTSRKWLNKIQRSYFSGSTTNALVSKLKSLHSNVLMIIKLPKNCLVVCFNIAKLNKASSDKFWEEKKKRRLLPQNTPESSFYNSTSLCY